MRGNTRGRTYKLVCPGCGNLLAYINQDSRMPIVQRLAQRRGHRVAVRVLGVTVDGVRSDSKAIFTCPCGRRVNVEDDGRS